MTEPIYLRVRRVLSASTEDAVDALQRARRGVVVPESFTHGSARKR